MSNPKGSRLRHGMTGTAIHRTWLSMKRRCDNPNATNYYLYGGRGIKYDERWKVFENFYEDMGDRPSDKHSLDRIDHDGDYCKDNCRWATVYEQANNKRNNRFIVYNGKSKTLSEWARIGKMSTRTLWCRIEVLKWGMDKAMNTEVIIGRNQYGTKVR